MKPKDSNINSPAKDNCIPTSAKCIIWQGPDIPCINLCRGDHIELVVFKLAQKLCEITDGLLDVSELDFECLIGPESPDPKNLKELLQRLITKVCLLEECCEEEDPEYELPIIELPACLVYTDPDTELEVTELNLSDLAELLATKICEILDEIELIKIDIENLDERITEIEAQLSGMPEPTEEVLIETKCLSYTDLEGESLSVKEAFENLEERLCEYVDILGTVSSLQSSIEQECVDLSDEDQLSDSDSIMSDLPDWVDNPATVADTLNNMWLTICDMRAYLQTIGVGGAICIPVTPVDIVLDNLTTSTFDISWTAPVITGTEPVAAYEIVIVEYDGFTEGIVIYTSIQGANVTSLTLSNYDFEANFPYRIKVRAIYETCGNSGYVTTYGNVRDDLALVCAEVEISDAEIVSTTCLGSPVNNARKTITARLINTINGNDVINNSGAGLDFVVDIEYTDCNLVVSTETLTVTIPDGLAFGYEQFYSTLYVDCGMGSCGPELREVTCVTPPEGYTLCDTDLLCP